MPGPNALVLIVGIWAVIAGVAELTAAVPAGGPGSTRAMLILGGLASVVLRLH
jgi:hypothetical protein